MPSQSKHFIPMKELALALVTLALRNGKTFDASGKLTWTFESTRDERGKVVGRKTYHVIKKNGGFFVSFVHDGPDGDGNEVPPKPHLLAMSLAAVGAWKFPEQPKDKIAALCKERDALRKERDALLVENQILTAEIARLKLFDDEVEDAASPPPQPPVAAMNFAKALGDGCAEAVDVD